MKDLTSLQNFLFRMGAVLMLFGAGSYMFLPKVAMPVYGIGVLLFSMMRLQAEYLGHDVTVMRLRRQQLLACCLFVLALVMMSMEQHQWGPCRRREWVVALTIGCVLELYTSFRIPHALSDE